MAAALLAVTFYRVRAGEGYPLDDSWIHLAFARNLGSGLGFGANPHEPTPGATSPLWILALAPGFALGLGEAVWPWLLSGLLLGAAGIASAALVLQLGAHAGGRGGAPLRWASLLCGVTVAWTAPLVWSAAGAMEVPLFSTLICAALTAHGRRGGAGPRRGILWGGLTGLAALARPEGLLLAALLVAARLLRRTRSSVTEAASGLATCSAVYAPSVLFCLATSGRLFPNTFYAKTTALVAGTPDPAFLWNAAILLLKLAPTPLFALAVGIAMTAYALWRRQASETALAAGAFAVALPFAYAAMGRTFLFAGLAGNFGRYLYPVMPPALALGFWGLWVLAAEFPRRGVQGVSAALAIAALAVSGLGTLERVWLYTHNVRDINTMQVAMARELRSQLEPGALVAANDVGALAYLTEFRVLDLVGIISIQTLDALEEAGSDERARSAALRELLRRERPAALVVFPQWFAGALRQLNTRLRVIAVAENPSNITSGGPRLVAYRLDWSAQERR